MKKLAIATLFVASLLVTFIAGFRVGGEAATYSELTLKGVMATYYLCELELELERSESAPPLQVAFESDIANSKWAHEQLMSPIYTYGAKLSGVSLAGQEPKYINKIMAYSPKCGGNA